MKIIAVFNCKGGVGTSTLAYHLGWMLADLNCRVVMADLDPQANLTSMFLDDDRLDELWPAGEHPCTIHGLLEPMIRGIRDIGRQIHIEPISGGIGLIVGDLGLSAFDDKLCESRAISGAMSRAASDWDAEYVLVDPGPNPGAITRAALIAADHVIVPVASDLFSLQGLRNLGPRLREWRAGRVPPLGYVVTQHAIRQNRPVREYSRWLNRIPGEYRESVLGEVASCPLAK